MTFMPLSNFVNKPTQNDVTIYCFEIILPSGQKLFLTSSFSAVQVDQVTYYPFSGLDLKNCIFNDASDNHVIISGIYENQGITRETDVIDAVVKMYILTDQSLHLLCRYSCREYNKSDLDFTLKLEPETYKYAAQAVKVFSKTCRANLGDEKCSVNLNKLSKVYQVENIHGKEITLTDMIEQNGYYVYGKAIIENSSQRKYVFQIISQFHHKIYLSDVLNNELLTVKTIKLIPGCDKKFITCCKKFNNALNFRGEPFVPEFHTLEN